MSRDDTVQAHKGILATPDSDQLLRSTLASHEPQLLQSGSLRERPPFMGELAERRTGDVPQRLIQQHDRLSWW